MGIGTSSPDAVLTSVNSGALTLDSNDGNHSGFGLLIEPSTITANTVNSAIGFAKSDGRKYAAIGMQTYADVDQNGLNFYVQSTTSGSSAVLSEAMRIDSDGNVGIGTSSPSSVLHLSTSNDPQITLTDTGFGASADITGSNGNLRLNSQTATIFDMADSEVMRLDSSGHLIVPNGVTLGTAVGTYDSANTLDDYEQGSWTPTADFATTSPTSGVGVHEPCS